MNRRKFAKSVWPRMVVRGFVLVLVVVTATGALADLPTTVPTGRAGQRLVNGQWIRPSARLSWDDLLRMDLHDGQLAIDMTATDQSRRLLAGGRRAAVEIAGSPDVWIVAQSRFTGGADPARHGEYFRALAADTRPAPAGEARYRPVEISVDPTGILIRGAGALRGQNVQTEIRIQRRSGTTSIAITERQGAEQPRGLQAAGIDWRILWRDYRAPLQQYVRPLLQEIAGKDLFRIRAGDAYRIFTEIQPSEELRARIQPLIDGLAHHDPQVRDDAEKKLEQIGAQAILVAMRTHPDTFAPGQRLRVQQLITRNCVLLDEQIADAEHDLLLLAECLDFDDRAVRAAAHARLEREIGEEIDFDLDLEGARRAQAVKDLSLRLTHPVD